MAKIEPTSPNTLIAFAAKAGSTASDGDSRNSPYSVALIEHLPKPGLDLRRAFGFIRDDVLKNTSKKQEPYVYGSLGGNDVPLVPVKPSVANGPQADPNASIRKDYELAMQLGTRDVWEAFLAQYPQGFYTSLAKGQLSRIAAEEARLAAVEKARLAEQEKARLVAEGARQAEQAKAAAAAKAAEDARIAAEKAKQVEQEKVAAAERARIAEQEKVRLAAEKVALEKAAAAERARLAEEAKARSDEERKQLAALQPAPTAKLSPSELTTSLQLELRRVGCLSASATGEWGTPSERSLSLFNKHAGTKFEVKAASLEAFDAVKAKTGRVCPLICSSGYKVDSERCVKISCRSGYRLNENDECEKIETRKPTAKREESKRDRPERANAVTAPAKPQASGQMICTLQGCRPLNKGCRIGSHADRRTGGDPSHQTEICN